MCYIMNITEKLSFFDLMYQHNLIPTINKPTRVGENSATAIDHIITEYLLTCDFKTAILKTDWTDHFPIVIALKMMDRLSNIQKINVCTNVAIMKKISKLLITDDFQSIGMKLETAVIPMRLIQSF